MNDGHFAVMEAWCTGADEYAVQDTLEDALDLRDELTKTKVRYSTGPLFFVVDRDDPERGWLEWEDVEVSA